MLVVSEYLVNTARTLVDDQRELRACVCVGMWVGEWVGLWVRCSAQAAELCVQWEL